MTSARGFELAPRLRSLTGASIGIVFNGKKSCEPLMRAVARVLQEEDAVEASYWKKPSPYKPIAVRTADTICERVVALVAGPGDCGHGAACSRLDATQFEARGIPVAWLDTAGRIPRVRRDRDRFVIEYGANRWVEAGLREQDVRASAVRQRLSTTFEKFGFHRALRLAGARPGDTIQVGSLDLELWDYPESAYPHIPDGMLDHPYIVIEPIVRMSAAGLEREATRLAPLIRRALQKPRSS